MLDTIKKNSLKPTEVESVWADDIFESHYTAFYESLTSKQLDIEFSKDLNTLVNVLSKLPASEREAFIDVFSNMIEFYMGHKVEKELDIAFRNILSF